MIAPIVAYTVLVCIVAPTFVGWWKPAPFLSLSFSSICLAPARYLSLIIRFYLLLSVSLTLYTLLVTSLTLYTLPSLYLSPSLSRALVGRSIVEGSVHVG